MNVSEIMTQNPACVTPSDSIQTCAKQMVDCNCGVLPVIDNPQNKKLIGVVTDRDIVTRVIATGMDCAKATAQNAMTSAKLWMVKPNDSVDKVIEAMEQGQVRRIAVVDDNQQLVGIVSTADIVKEVELEQVGEVLIEISEPMNI